MVYDKVPSEEQVNRFFNEAFMVRYIAIDTETNSQDIRDGRGYACGVSIAYRKDGEITAFYMPFRHQHGSNFNIDFLRHQIQKLVSNKHIIFHNAKFDLVSLETLGIDTSNCDFYDTMLMAHMINENMKFVGGFKLDILSKRWLGLEGKAYSPAIEQYIKEDFSFLPSNTVAEYAATDAALTLQLFEYIYPKFKDEKLEEVWKVKREFTRLLIKMERKGILVDKILAENQIKVGYNIMADHREELGWRNPASPKDLEILLLSELNLPEIINPKTGRRTFDKSAMAEYELILEHVHNPIAGRILEFRGWSKTISSNYEPYLLLISPDGRLRCNYKMHGTLTGRLSCELPNLQQIPRESTKPWNGHLKNAFIPESGKRLLEADYSQLELRLGAAYAEEQALIQVFEEDRDIFQEMATALGQTRQDTKTMSYAIAYGAGVNRIANVLGIPQRAAKNRIDTYYSTYPGFRRIQDRVQKIVERHKKVPLWSGRFRHFQFPTESYKAFNSLIQGGSWELVERVMLRLDRELPEASILLTIHDSVVFEIDEDKVDDLIPEIRRIMTSVNEATGQDFKVPFAVDIHTWGGK